MKRGDIVVVALAGDLGKPRPAVVVESDRLAPTDHVLVCPGTSHVRTDIRKRRVLVEPSASNRLRKPTQFQIDKISAVRRERCDQQLGRLDAEALERLDLGLAVVLGLADPR